MYFSKQAKRFAKDTMGFLARDKEKCPTWIPAVIWCTLIPLLWSQISKASELKWAKYSFSVSCLPCWKLTKVADVFLRVWLVAMCVLNASANYLKLPIDYAGNVMN